MKKTLYRPTLASLAVRQRVEEACEVLLDDVGEFVFQAIFPVIEDLTNLNALLNLVYLTPFKENLFDISLIYQINCLYLHHKIKQISITSALDITVKSSHEQQTSYKCTGRHEASD